MHSALKRCAVAILITGSISSTSGAVDCSAPPPDSAEAALNIRPAVKELPITYREEIYHPALTDPMIKTGWFGIGRSGTLIRHEITPNEEEVEIGERLLTQRRGDWENIWPIPDRMQPMLSVLRGVMLGDLSAIAVTDSDLSSDSSGWRLNLVSDSDTNLALVGCGETLTAIDLMLRNGERRHIEFE